MSSLVRMSGRVPSPDFNVRFIKGHVVEFKPRGVLTDALMRKRLVTNRVFSTSPERLVGEVINPCYFTGTDFVEVRWRGSMKTDIVSASNLRRSTSR